MTASIESIPASRNSGACVKRYRAPVSNRISKSINPNNASAIAETVRALSPLIANGRNSEQASSPIQIRCSHPASRSYRSPFSRVRLFRNGEITSSLSAISASIRAASAHQPKVPSEYVPESFLFICCPSLLPPPHVLKTLFCYLQMFFYSLFFRFCIQRDI